MGRFAAADVIMDVMSAYAVKDSSLSLAALAGARRFQEWVHYPQEDAFDATHRTGFYYHAHAKSERPEDEHGHFHVFARASSQPGFHHLAGISLGATGWPRCIFLTNQWVTGETWLATEGILPHLKNFYCELHGRLSPVARWITGMIHLYQEEIIMLHQEKDGWLARQTVSGKTLADRKTLQEKALQSTTHHVVAKQPIDLAQDLKKILNHPPH